jgi:hypothetical protein
MRNTVAQLRAQHRQHLAAVARWKALRDEMPARVEAAGGLTICSVGYRARRCLDLNDVLIRQLNPGARVPEWLLFDNNVEPNEMLDPDDPRFTIVRPPAREIDMGYEHALGISALLPRVKTRFLLVLDPDCFIVLPDWLRRIPEHMDAHRLGFFGTPINPRRHNSYRYFPYMVCMFVDLSRVSLRDLCFLPGVWHWWPNATYRIRKALAGVPKAGALFRWMLTEQWRTNGWQIKARFGSGREVSFECAQPVWDVDAAVPRGGLKRIMHTVTPASVSPIPKQPGYCSPRGFASMGAPDVAALGWEEFVWRGQPFAFHVGSVHSPAASGEYYAALSRTVEAFLQLAPVPVKSTAWA